MHLDTIQWKNIMKKFKSLFFLSILLYLFFMRCTDQHKISNQSCIQTARRNSTYSHDSKICYCLKNGTRPKKKFFRSTNGLRKPLSRKSESLTLTVSLLLTQSVASVEAPWPCSGFHKWGECSLIINAEQVEKLCWNLKKK